MRVRSLCTIFTIALPWSVAACEPSSWSQFKTAETTSDVAYVRLPARFLTKEFLESTGFNRDHVRDDVYAFGYLDRAQLEKLPLDVFREVVELDAKARSHHE